MKKLIEELKNDYDIIIVDSPPAAKVTDSVILSSLVDGVLMVISASETHIEMARLAKKSLDGVDANLLGAILVRIDNKSLNGYYKYYSYGYQ